tara:strand:- start:180200 stop:181177 length:978 start_codon:yes stop_codon:yes gene_type:complete
MSKLTDNWYRTNSLTVLLIPLSWLFYIVILLRRFCYRISLCRSQSFPVPIIVIGNITVGGTGKTPMIIALANHLQQQGFKPAIVSRGYGGHNQKPRIVTPNSQPSLVGDEPILIARHTNCPMVICRNRPAAVQALLNEHDCDVILSDDGLQHYALKRDIEVVMVDGSRRFGNQHLLPAGPLREPVSRLAKSDFTVVNGKAEQSEEFSMRIIVGNAYCLTNPRCQRPLLGFANRTVHAVAGIGNPDKFFASLRAENINVIEHAFPDHYDYQANDLNFGDDLPIIMTEKDAVKCHEFVNSKTWCLPIIALPEENFLQALLSKLKELS